MTDLIPVGLQRFGGGARMQNAVRTGKSANVCFVQPGWVSYKLKVDGSGYWDKNQTTALAAATSQTIVLGTTFEDLPFPTNVLVTKCLVNLIEVFAGGTIASFAIDVGDAGTVDEWVDGLNVFTGASLGWAADVDEGASAIVGGVVETAYAPRITIASGTGDVDELTTGELDLHFYCVPLPPVLP